MGTCIDLINNTIIPNIVDNRRILIAINRCDLANGGIGWNKKGNYPEKELVQRLNEKVKSVRRRIKESTGVDIHPIYYSALYKYNISKLLSFIIKCTPTKKRFFYINNINTDENNWIYDDRKANDKKIDELSDDLFDLKLSIDKIENKINNNYAKSYQQETEELMSQALDEVSEEISKDSKVPIKFTWKNVISNISDGISKGSEIGESIGQIVPIIGKGAGKIIGGVIGGAGGFFKSLFKR